MPGNKRLIAERAKSSGDGSDLDVQTVPSCPALVAEAVTNSQTCKAVHGAIAYQVCGADLTPAFLHDPMHDLGDA